MPNEILSLEEWVLSVERRLGAKELHPLEVAQQAAERYPDNGLVLELAAFAARWSRKGLTLASVI